MAYRTRVFIDFWNFQLNWNDRASGAKIDWPAVPRTLIEEGRKRHRPALAGLRRRLRRRQPALQRRRPHPRGRVGPGSRPQGDQRHMGSPRLRPRQVLLGGDRARHGHVGDDPVAGFAHRPSRAETKGGEPSRLISQGGYGRCPDPTRRLRRGGEALRAHERLLEHFADLLAAGRGEAPGGEELPAISERFLLAALASILAERLDPTKGRGLAGSPGLAAELTEFVLAAYVGPARAAVWARLRPAARARLSSDAELLQPVEFTELLARLQGVIGSEAQVVVNLPGHFFDCGFHARLERVETLSGKDGPVLLVFAGAQGVALDPDEFDSFLARWPGRPGYAWIELRLGDRLHLVIEPLSDPE